MKRRTFVQTVLGGLLAWRPWTRPDGNPAIEIPAGWHVMQLSVEPPTVCRIELLLPTEPYGTSRALKTWFDRLGHVNADWIDTHPPGWLLFHAIGGAPVGDGSGRLHIIMCFIESSSAGAYRVKCPFPKHDFQKDIDEAVNNGGKLLHFINTYI